MQSLPPSTRLYIVPYLIPCSYTQIKMAHFHLYFVCAQILIGFKIRVLGRLSFPVQFQSLHAQFFYISVLSTKIIPIQT